MRIFRKKHFTLVEIMTVILVILFLAGMVFTIGPIAAKKNGEAVTRGLMNSVSIALEQYKAWEPSGGNYPISGDLDNSYSAMFLDVYNSNTIRQTMCQFFDSNTLTNYCMVDAKTSRPYVIDGFGSPFVYCCPGVVNTGGFDLISLGEDKMAGYGKESNAKVFGASDLTSKKDSSGKIVYNGGISVDNSDNMKKHIGHGDDITNY